MTDLRIYDLPRASTIAASDLFVLQQGDDAKSLTGQVLLAKLAAALAGQGGTEWDIYAMVAANAGAHNSILRGRNLGDSASASQYAAIEGGTFDNLFVNDYWTINGVNWRIGALDYYLYSGDTSITTHHAVIVPDTPLYTYQMNESNTTAGGYVGSKMRTDGLSQAREIINAAFPGHVISHRIYLTNGVTDGIPSSGAWVDSDVDLMNEQMVYGGSIFSPMSDGTTVPTNYRVEKSQLPLFAHIPDRISRRANYWLRDVASDSTFAGVSNGGGATRFTASSVYGVRPCFCIG